MKTQRTRALVAALALLVAAQAAAAKDTWTSVRSQNFFLVGNASEKEIRQVATRLEQFRDVFKRLFTQVNFSSPVPTTVVVFKSHAAYKPFKPVADGKTVAVAGYFQPGDDVNYITLTTERGAESPYSVIYHEYVHLLVNNSLGRGAAPAWFNEGLAEYYRTFAVEDDRKVHLGKFVDEHLYLLRQQRMLPLAQLLAVDHHSLERNRHDVRGLFYAQSWALVHYLILGNEGRRLPQLGQFLELTRRGVPTPEAGETRLRAALTRIECGPKRLVFVFRAGDRTLRLASAGFGGLHIVAYTPEAGAELSCGARKAETPAVVTYCGKADARAKTDGALVALEFVPADFQLK